MIVISSSLVLGGITEELGANNPVIGYHNLVTISNIEASESATNFPVTNLANPSTAEVWKADSIDDHMLTILVDYELDVDYIGIARHNFGSGHIPVTIQISTSPGVWTTVVDQFLPADDEAIIARFSPTVVLGARILLEEGDEIPTAAVVYFGKLLVMQRRLYVGHTPFPFAKQTTVSNGKSENGQFLGRIVLSEKAVNMAAFKNLVPSWVRTYLKPFLAVCQTVPFFFAWRPSSYPLEVGYVWVTNDPQPNNQRNNGMMQVDLAMSGFAE